MKVTCGWCLKPVDTITENYQYDQKKHYHFDIFKPDTCWAKKVKWEHDKKHNQSSINTETF